MKHGLLLFAFSVMVICASAQVYSYPSVTPSGHTLYYDIANGEATVAKKNYNYPNYGNTLSGDLIIPDSVEYAGVKYPVTTIGHEAFEYATMRSVQIPNTVRTIIIRAFSACDSLTSLVIPNSVTSIGMQAFAGSFNITSIVLPDSLTTIEQGIFEYDTSLISVVVPDAVVSVGHGAFSQCYSLRSVTFGASVISIGGLSFWNCYALDSLIFKSNVSPSVGTNMFPGAPDTLVIDIPCGSYHSYLPAFGEGHIYIVPSVNLSMSVSSSAPEWGSANVVLDADQQDVRCDSSAVIQAVANYGYHFTGWSNGSMASLDTLMIDRDSVLTASFAKNSYSVEVQSSDPTIGSVSGGGVFEYLDTTVLTANAVEPYHFVRWNDGNTQNPRPFVVTGDAVRTAIFSIDTFTVSLMVDSVTHGTCTGFGNYPYGAAASVVAVPYSGYQFSHWSDGSTFNPYSFAVVDDVQLTAIFYADGTPYQDTLEIHDTVLVDVPVHDTTYITISVTVIDTLWQNDTIYLPQYIMDTMYVDVPVHDTTYITLTDTILFPVTDSLWLNDTVYLPQYIFDTMYVDVPVHDTTYITLTDTVLFPVTDTLWLHDTVYLPQYIHDTIYVGVDDVNNTIAKIYSSQGKIVVEGADGNAVTLFDVNGRIVATQKDYGSAIRFDVPASGTYMIKIGNHHARKVVVIK